MEILSGNGNERAFWLNLFSSKCCQKMLQQKCHHKIQFENGPKLQHVPSVFFHFLALLRFEHSGIYHSLNRKKSNCCESGAQQFNYTYSFFVRRIRFQCLLSSFLLSLHFIYLYTPRTHTHTHISVLQVRVRLCINACY